MNNINDTIAAASTPYGRGAISVLRLSGEDAETVAIAVCPELRNAADRVMTRITLADKNGSFDDGLACVMRAPHSYTGQTTVEIYGHGSPSVTAHALDVLYKAGARPAEAGEFTRRALLNGKLDLLQAEAVADMINADTPAAARNALGHLRGNISRRITQAWEQTTAVISHVAACADYPEDDIPDITADEITNGLTAAADILRELLNGYSRGKYAREGVHVAIAGPPNAGKSSLFNALLGRDRAIVTEIAGTTRDSIEESIIINGMRIILHDTAGLRDTDDIIEAEGVRRSRTLIENAALTLYVIDGTQQTNIPEIENMLVVANKSDMPSFISHPEWIAISALTGQGLNALTEAISKYSGVLSPDETLLANARHAAAVQTALDGITAAQHALNAGFSPDTALGELEYALDALSELTGKKVNEAVLEQIFSQFCVGK